jgi:hypothetical protein
MVVNIATNSTFENSSFDPFINSYNYNDTWVNTTSLLTSTLSSVNNSSSKDDDDLLSMLNVPYTIMELVVATVAVIGNALVIIVFYRERRLRRRTNYYIISLALADFLVGLLGIPFAILVSIRKHNIEFDIGDKWKMLVTFGSR